MRRRMMGGLVEEPIEDNWNYIMCKLNVTTTTERTTVFSSTFTGLSQIDYITFNEKDNATRYAFDTGFQFTWTGERLMFVHFKKGTTNLDNLFADVTCITYVDMNELDTRLVTSMTGTFQGCINMVQCLMSNCSAESLTYMVNTFNSCTNLKYVDFGSYITGNFKPKKLKDIRNMFNWCRYITTINMSMFDLSTVELFGYTWGNCKSLTEIFINTSFSPTASMSTNMFANDTLNGIIYYNSQYNVSQLANVKPSNWQLVPYNYLD